MNSYLLAVFLGYFLSVTCFALVLNGVLLRFSRTLGIRNRTEGMIRWNSEYKPSLGGISFYLLFLLSVASYTIFFTQAQPLLNTELLGLLVSGSLAFMMGLADDAYNTRPLLKLSAQIACAIILIMSGVYIKVFNDALPNYLLTIFWVVGMMNSINMLDNMDGITTVISINILAFAIFFEYLRYNYDTAYFMIMIGVLAALCGFLYYNWNPSKLFMGDTGSQFLGVFLAAVGIKCFWNGNDFSQHHDSSRQLFVAVLAFIMPVIDTSIVIINRVAKGKSPFIGGKDHTTHHLVYMGFSERKVALIFAIISFFSLGISFLLNNYFPTWTYAHSLIAAIYIIGLWIYFYRITKKHHPVK
ncbi:MAG: glycosyltransferase family 4 protein [Bacteroidia bacterium]